IAYEYEERDRPLALEASWHFQTSVPVVETRYMLTLPSGWSYAARWRNHDEIAPVAANGVVAWTMRDVAAIDDEDRMPSVSALAGRVAFNFSASGDAKRSWSDIGRWYTALADPRCATSPQVQSQVRTL